MKSVHGHIIPAHECKRSVTHRNKSLKFRKSYLSIQKISLPVSVLLNKWDNDAQQLFLVFSKSNKQLLPLMIKRVMGSPDPGKGLVKGSAYADADQMRSYYKLT